MLIKMSPPSPGATISLARSAPDAQGCVLIAVGDIRTAQSHGWAIAAEEAAEAGQDADDFAAGGAAAPAAGEAAGGKKQPRVKM